MYKMLKMRYELPEKGIKLQNETAIKALSEKEKDRRNDYIYLTVNQANRLNCKYIFTKTQHASAISNKKTSAEDSALEKN